MSEFVFIFHGAPPDGTQVQRTAQMQKWMTWTKELSEKGHLKNPGSAVQPTGKIVKDRRRTTTDIVIDQALIGGVSVIEARDLDHAVEISTGCPIFDSGGTVEVRPVMKLS